MFALTTRVELQPIYVHLVMSYTLSRIVFHLSTSRNATQEAYNAVYPKISGALFTLRSAGLHFSSSVYPYILPSICALSLCAVPVSAFH